MTKPSKSHRPARLHQSLEEADLALRLRRPDQAERLAAQILKSDRTNAKAAVILGQALLAQGRTDEAVASLEKLARRTDDSEVDTLLARALVAAGRSEDAEGQLTRAVARLPHHLPAFRELAAHLERTGRRQDAIEILERGTAAAPESADLHADLGFLYARANQRARAREALLAATNLRADMYDALAALARFMLADYDCAPAADVFRRALALRPNEPALRIDFGRCLLELGDREQGERELREAARDPAMFGRVILTLTNCSHGRFFLQRSRAVDVLRVEQR